jgi:hypothetical protein
MNFPLDLRFKILALASQISVTDAQGRVVLYARQKAFKLKEAVTVFADSTQTRALYTIAADRILDVSARYRIADQGGVEVGVLQRHGMRSFWRAHYDILQDGRQTFVIREENPWIKVVDGVLGSIPILSFFTGYFFHPAYLVSRSEGQPPLLRVVKQPALLEGRYRIDLLEPSQAESVEVAVLSVLMMVLLERARG